jgi:hypothetical protein
LISSFCWSSPNNHESRRKRNPYKSGPQKGTKGTKKKKHKGIKR